MEVTNYATSEGRQPFQDWYDTLDGTAKRVVSRHLVRLADGHFGDAKAVGGGVFERRIHTGPGYRLYYSIDGRRVILLLGGGTKRGQSRDIARAIDRLTDHRSTRETPPVRRDDEDAIGNDARADD